MGTFLHKTNGCGRMPNTGTVAWRSLPTKSQRPGRFLWSNSAACGRNSPLCTTFCTSLQKQTLQNILEFGFRLLLEQKRGSSSLYTSPSPYKCLTPFGSCTVTAIPCPHFRKSCKIKPQCNKNSVCNITTNFQFNSEHPLNLQVQWQDCTFNTLLIKNSAPCKLHIIKFLHYPVSVSHYCISFMF